ncbi:capsule assembly Wzi family protein [Lacihabitans soyangensis]|uniref:capsule assembly Wzi family protein n=1 Tax=Lacihabitans soyangensis TaxID=869394 RepID=UPI0020CD39CC|nr:capsule assembly Wzi family protein [Lacihabitans soyangensis]
MIILLNAELSAQKIGLNVEFESGYSLSSHSEVPFWQRANHYGARQKTGNKGFISQTSTLRGYHKNKDFKYEVKTSTLFTIERNSKFLLTELNLKLNYKDLCLSLGRSREHYGLTDSTTSSGSMTNSHNALPIPQIKIGLSQYKKLLLKILFIKGHFSHGWFGNQKWASHYYLHQKNISLRLGKDNARFNMYGEIMHNTQWGGKPKYSMAEGETRYINGRFPSGWYTYKNVVFPLLNPKKDSTINISAFDYENRFGNHIGQISFGGSLDMAFSRFVVYKELLFETGQTFSSLTNIDDGLYGLSYVSKLTKPYTKRLSVEYFQTTNQGMYRPGLLKLFRIKGKHYGRNRNNYYNHNQYLDGWSYNGSNIGSPFIIPRTELNLLNDTAYSSYMFLYNRVKALYLGAENNFWNMTFLTKISVSSNFGQRDGSFPDRKQFAGNISCTKEFVKSKSSVILNVGLDRGDLLPQNLGVQLAWKKLW